MLTGSESLSNSWFSVQEEDHSVSFAFDKVCGQGPSLIFSPSLVWRKKLLARAFSVFKRLGSMTGLSIKVLSNRGGEKFST